MTQREKRRRPDLDIELARGPFGTYLIKHFPTGLDILVQTDYDYPGLARSFGWTMRARRLPDADVWDQITPPYHHPMRQYCHHDNTDGTVTCDQCGRTATEFISEAREWLDNHIGTRTEDPGYFSREYIEQETADDDSSPEPIRLYECGICDHLHPWSWSGDCRDDANRYSDEDDYRTRNGLPSDTRIDVLPMSERLAADENREEN